MFLCAIFAKECETVSKSNITNGNSVDAEKKAHISQLICFYTIIKKPCVRNGHVKSRNYFYYIDMILTWSVQNFETFSSPFALHWSKFATFVLF